MPLPPNENSDHASPAMSVDNVDPALAQRLARLTPAQRALLERKLQKRRPPVSGAAVSQTTAAAASPAPRHDEPIAVVGMSCRFPGAADVDAFWDLIRQGRDATAEIPPSRWDVERFYDPTGTEPGKMSVRRGGFLSDVDQFDPAFFGITPREASRIDPQQRLLLEVVWEAIENAGIAPATLTGSNTGVFVGIGGSDYAKIPQRFADYYAFIDAHVGTGNALSIAAGRISYILDLQGPSYIVDTACSSGLVAVNNAIEALRQGHCDAALAGGVNLILVPDVTIAFAKARMLSPDGVCRPFDAAANGYVRGEGCAMVMLKRLGDAIAAGDPIHGVLRGSAVNQDGRTSGITAPNSGSQVACIRTALQRAGLTTDQIDHIEAHGTATPLGDPIELQALCQLFARTGDDDSPVTVTSVKANIGHTETVSGMAGLLKVLLMLRHRIVPGQVHLKKLNPAIKLDGSRLRIPTESATWRAADGPERPLRAGVSSFGFGGTNAHVVVEEYRSPRRSSAPPPTIERSASGEAAAPTVAPLIVPVSGRGKEPLAELAARWAKHLTEHPDLALPDIARTAAMGRNHFTHRAALIAHSTDELTRQLDALARGNAVSGLVRGQAKLGQRPAVAMLFTGQGAQYVGMGRQLAARFPIVDETLRRCATAVADQLEHDLLDVIFGNCESAAELLNRTEYTQPALVAIEIAVAALWRHVGVSPAICGGHSVGEYAAAHLAGVMDLETTMRLIAERGRLMQQVVTPGAMAALLVDRQRAAEAIAPWHGRLTVAACNGPENTVVSGDADAMEELLGRIADSDVVAKRLTVSHAFHSHQMDPILDRFRRFAATCSFAKPKRKLVSNLTGRLLSEPPDAEYWTRHLREEVKFTDCAAQILRAEPTAIIEVGPTPHLSGMVRRVAIDAGQGAPESPPQPSLRPGSDDTETFLSAVAAVHCVGTPLDWQRLPGIDQGHRLRLPTYPFQRQRHWFEEQEDQPETSQRGGRQSDSLHPLLGWPVAVALDQRVFESDWGTASPAYLADHVVQGSVVVPAAAFLETALSAAEQTFAAGIHRVTDFTIERPLFLADLPIPVQTTVSPSHRGRAVVEIYSLPDGDAERRWVLHARATLVAEPDAGSHESSPSAATGDGKTSGDAAATDTAAADATSDHKETSSEAVTGPERARRRIEREVACRWDHTALYDELAARRLDYGPAFRPLDQVVRSAAEAWAECRVPDAIAESTGYRMHPVFLDACMQTMAAITPLEADGTSTRQTYLPVGVGELVVFHSGIPRTIHAMRVTPDPAEVLVGPADTVSGNLDVFDADDRLMARLIDVRVRRATTSGSAGEAGRDPSDWVYELDWQPLETPTDSDDNAIESRRWCLVTPVSGNADIAGRLEAIATGLRDSGDQVSIGLPTEADRWAGAEIVWFADDRGLTDDRGGRGRKTSESDVTSLIDAATAGLWTLVEAIQAWVLAGGQPPRLTLVTRQAQAVDESDPLDNPLAGAIWGLGRVVQLEHPELRTRLIDIDRMADDRLAALLRGADAATGDEDQLALRDGRWWSVRLRDCPSAVDEQTESSDSGELSVPGSGSFRLRLDDSNQISGLWLERFTSPAPPAGHVEIAVEAAGLNFSDVLKAMGLYPGITDTIVPLGIECAGVVTRVGPSVTRLAVGDRVFGVAPLSFASHTIAPEHTLAAMPTTLTAAEAATVPITLLTAWYGMVQLADLQPGERVLIHAAAGGVGLAAIQIAQSIGAEVFATAGSDEKRDYLRSLGIRHIYNSRTLEFADQILAQTDGQGVDVVLNSLPGEAIDRSLSLLAAYGRFLEIGKVDIYQNHRIGLLPFQDNLSYFAIDLDRVLRQRPALVTKLFDGVLAGLESGAYRPLPKTEFDIADVRDAFRYMAQRKNIGKVVVDLRRSASALNAGSATGLASVSSAAATESGSAHGDGDVSRATQLITGGLGAIGLQLAERLTDDGETHLALLARREPTTEVASRIAALRRRGVAVAILAGDVSDEESLAAALATLPEAFPTIGGVWHAAGVLDDQLLVRMTEQRFTRPLAPKLQGTWNLHRLTADLPIERFVLFSSIASLLGSPGQANYAAANAVLDSFARYRRGRGMPATVINWGPWASGGMAIEEGRDEQLNSRGLTLLPTSDALDLLTTAVRRDTAQWAVLDADWSKMVAGLAAVDPLPSLLREVATATGGPQVVDKVDHGLRDRLLTSAAEQRVTMLRDYFAVQLGMIMGLAADQLDPDQSLGAMGLDSLMAIELKNTIEARIGVVLPMARFLEGPSLQDLALQVAELLTDGQDVATVERRESASTEHDGPRSQPLSQGQSALWFIHQLAPEETAYNISDAVRIEGSLQNAALEAAIATVVSRHDALRTTFHSDGGRPYALVADSIATPLAFVDATAWPEAKLRQQIAEQTHRPFDLEQGPLLRVIVFRRGEHDHVLFFAVHHIIADFWSLVHCTHQFRQIYADLVAGRTSDLPPQTHQYRDFVDWQPRMLATPEGQRQQQYWLDLLGGELPVLELPTDRPRPAEQTFVGGLAFRWLDPELTESIKRFAQQRQVTLNVVLLTAYQLLLHRLSGQNDVLVGMPTSGRSRAEFADVVGYFVNPVIARSRLDPAMTTDEFLEQTRQGMLGALEHQDYPLPLLVDRLKPPRDPSRSTLFQALFVMQKAQVMHDEGMTPFLMGRSGAELAVGDLTFRSQTLDHWTAQFDISLAASEADDGISLGLQFNRDLFDAATAERMLQRYERLLRSLVGTPTGRLARHDCLIDDERLQVTRKWAAAPESPEPLLPVIRRFEAQVARTPDAVAVVQPGEPSVPRGNAGPVKVADVAWTYRELNDHANDLAADLIAQRVGPGQAVGIALPRCPELIAALLAVWKVGAAYVPLDLNYPPARLRHMIETSGMVALIGDDGLDLAGLGEELPILSPRRQELSHLDASNPDVAVDLDDIAYIIFTSGSTGQPKGAAVKHRGFANLLQWYLHEFRWSAADRVLVVTSHGFDLTQKNLFAPLLIGGQLHLAPSGPFDPETIGTEIGRGEISIVNCTPSNFYPIVAHTANLDPSRLGSLRAVVLGGEPIDLDRLADWRGRPWCRAQLVNSYGPTECSDVVAYHLVGSERGDESTDVPIGRPVSGCRLYVLDESRSPVPPGVVGQLFVGGVCVGAGYINDAELTVAKFVADPIACDGTAMYATGDLCRWNGDGLLEFIGRVDHQVKIRGYRIELGEVEAALGRLPGIERAVAIVRQDTPGQPRLVAYVTLAATATATTETILAGLRDQLPPQLVPSAVVILDAIPLSPHGKVDRRALPPPDRRESIASSGFVTPDEGLESELAAVWADLLRIERVGAYDNFFSLGGDSLLAIQLVAALSDLGYRCRPADLLRWQTVRELAAGLAATQSNPAAFEPVTEAALLPAQAEWVRRHPDLPSHDHLRLVLRLTESLEPDRFRRAVERVLDRHDALRSRPSRCDGDWQQTFPKTAADDTLRIIATDSASGDASEMIATAVRQACRETDILNTPPVRFLWFPSQQSEGTLAITAHHWAIDPVSLRIVAEDLLLAYQLDNSFEPTPLPGSGNLANRMRSIVQAGRLDSQRERWLRLAEASPRCPATLLSDDGDWVGDAVHETMEVEPGPALAIGNPDSHDGTASPWSTTARLLAALGRAYRRWSGLDSLRVDIERSGRNVVWPDVYPARTVGWLVSMFPYDIECGDADSTRSGGELSQRIEHDLHGLDDDGHGFELLRTYGDVETRHRLATVRPAILRFNYLGRIVDEGSLPVTVDRQLSGNSRSGQLPRPHPLELDLELRGDRLVIRWTFNPKRLAIEDWRHLADRFAVELRR